MIYVGIALAIVGLLFLWVAVVLHRRKENRALRHLDDLPLSTHDTHDPYYPKEVHLDGQVIYQTPKEAQEEPIRSSWFQKVSRPRQGPRR
jgi:uncharacterized membrane protein